MRTFWILFGVVTHVLFGLTVYRLVPFLDHGAHGYFHLVSPHAGGLWLDLLLVAQFAVLHSSLLLPGTRERLKPFIPGAQYGCFFGAVSCASLLLVMEAWQPSGVVVWRLHGAARLGMNVAFLLGWVALVYSMSLTGIGYQTGFTPWWAWVRGQRPPRREFAPRSLYRYLRHPIYLSFLALIWLTPKMTLDHAVVTLAWTGYLFVGSWLKDRRMVHYVGEPYRRYQAEVPGFPFLMLSFILFVPRRSTPSTADRA